MEKANSTRQKNVECLGDVVLFTTHVLRNLSGDLRYDGVKLPHPPFLPPSLLPLPTAQSPSRPRDPAPLDHIWILVLHSVRIPTLHLDEDPLRMQANAVQCASNLG
jgi:hypothetical protein